VTDGYVIRIAGLPDVGTMAAHRAAMFADLGHETPDTLREIEARFPTWVTPRLRDGTWRHWLVETDGRPVASAALWLREAPPGARPPDVVPTVLNVYVDAAHRRRGLARRLMQVILDVCRQDGFQPFVDLRASDMGRPLYESLGFEPTSEMRLALD
jgi:GNAT superfamily N-acetyltransferase